MKNRCISDLMYVCMRDYFTEMLNMYVPCEKIKSQF